MKILNLTFCGENIDQGIWDDTCSGETGTDTCDEFVANNPDAFKEAYWLLNSIKIYSPTSTQTSDSCRRWA